MDLWRVRAPARRVGHGHARLVDVKGVTRDAEGPAIALAVEGPLELQVPAVVPGQHEVGERENQRASGCVYVFEGELREVVAAKLIAFGVNYRVLLRLGRHKIGDTNAPEQADKGC